MREEKRILRCLNCGQEFEPTCHKTRQKFCCDACRQKYHNARRYYNVPVNICPECGVEVEQSGERGNGDGSAATGAESNTTQKGVRSAAGPGNGRRGFARTAGRNSKWSGGRGSSGGFAAMGAGFRGEMHITKRILVQTRLQSSARCAGRHSPGGSGGKDIAAGPVIYWPWSKRTRKVCANGVVKRFP